MDRTNRHATRKKRAETKQDKDTDDETMQKEQKNHKHTELNDVKKRYSIGTKFIDRWHSVNKVYVLKKTSYPFIYLMKLVTSGKA